ncbi:uncharacterized protein LOC114262775 [Camellia sinensis]|uniref:uncharacterized protein LOC114262775 n=1 Tax=Camellia sinensis TaxID=4442 RepID=UPI0010363BF6|nr:uncharacterized protein LOC114262775 [Camellia sinensis]
MSTQGNRGRMGSGSVNRGMAVPLAPVVTASAVGEEVAREIVRAVQDALARNEGDNGRTLKLTKEFLHSTPLGFLGEVKPLEVESWLEQITKTLYMFRVEDEGLRISLATFQLKGDANYWWKYAKNTIDAMWVAFTKVFLAKYFPHSTRERLREQFVELRQDAIPLAQFEMRFTSLSMFAPKLMATEERRCYEFEQRLRTKILFKVTGNMIREYDCLVEAAAHVEIIVEAKEERLQNSRSKGQGSQGDFRPNKKSKSTFSSQSQS